MNSNQEEQFNAIPEHEEGNVNLLGYMWHSTTTGELEYVYTDGSRSTKNEHF